MLAQKPELGVQIHLTFIQTFLWLLVAGWMGVLMAVPMRRHFIDEEKLTYADGVAAAETLTVLDAGGKEAKTRASALMWGAAVAMVATWFRDGWPRLIKKLHWDKLDFLTIPETSYFGKWGEKIHAHALHFGLNWSLLSIGSGMLVGLRINLSMALGMIISWIIAPEMLHSRGMIEGITYRMTLRWVMWPATGMMVAGGLTALALRWRTLARTFTALSSSSVGSREFPMRWVGGGLAVLTVALCFVQNLTLNIPAWQTLLAVLISVPLMLVSLRVLGETNWGPISTMGNMMQAVFAVISPGNIPANMASSGVAGSIVAESEGLIQDYKTGKLIGSNNRFLTYTQLIAVPIGAVSLALVYPLLRDKYGVGGDHGLSAPTAVKWAGFAELLSKGLASLPAGCLTAFIFAVVIGVVVTVGEERYRKVLPAPSAVGIGMLLPGEAILMMVIGGVIETIWSKRNKQQAEEMITPLASGFIAGEAILAVIVPVLMVLGILAG